MMTDRSKKKKKRRSVARSSKARNIEDDVLHRAMTADCGMLMSSTNFSTLITMLIQLMTLVVILLLSIVLSLLHDDSIAISYILLSTLLITILVYELGVTHWNKAYSGTFRLVILWTLWLITAVLFKLYAGIDVFGRVMAVLLSVTATTAAVLSLCISSTARLLSPLSVILLMFPLSGVGLFGDSTLLLSIRIVIYMTLCIILDRLYPEAKDNDSQLFRDVLLSVCCFWVLLVLPQFWVVAVLIIIISWYKRRRMHRTSTSVIDLHENTADDDDDNDDKRRKHSQRHHNKRKHKIKKERKTSRSPSPLKAQKVARQLAQSASPSVVPISPQPPATLPFDTDSDDSDTATAAAAVASDEDVDDIGGDDIDLSAFFLNKV